MIPQTGGILQGVLWEENGSPNTQATAFLHCLVCGPHTALLSYQLASYLEHCHDSCREGVKISRRSPIIEVKPEKEIRGESNVTFQVLQTQDCSFHHFSLLPITLPPPFQYGQ